ncbi:MAG TPA: wax ester/triacylglycerol synthase domain-containing protein, partial [Myxococcaceae bacterium]|nr:wax ester/triacylglycerol synthase domain-containing protein [Myxococcaceae bacterium]
MRTPLANVDASWLRMDGPTNPMVVTGLLVLATPVSVARVRSLLQERLLKFERFRQRIVRGLAGLPAWEADPQFSIDHHLVSERLAAPGDQAALQAYLGALASGTLPENRPPWRFHVLPYQDGTALVIRIHHAIADGLALVHVLLSLADQPAEIRMADGAEQPGAPRQRTVLDSVARATRLVPEGAGHLASLARLLLLSPDPGTRFKGPLGVQKALVWSRP